MIKTPSLIAAYNFNGNANDESGNVNNGFVDGATLVDTPFGQGYNFDGINDYIRLSNQNYNYSNGITISCWCYPHDITTNRYYEIYRKEDGENRILLSFQEYGTILAFGVNIYGRGYAEYEIAINAEDFVDKWSMISVTYDNLNVKIYINSILKKTIKVIGYIVNGGIARSYIGRVGDFSEFFKGVIGGLYIYNKALSDTDIKRIYEGFSPLNG